MAIVTNWLMKYWAVKSLVRMCFVISVDKKTNSFCLTHLCLAFHNRDIGKQCIPRMWHLIRVCTICIKHRNFYRINYKKMNEKKRYILSLSA